MAPPPYPVQDYPAPSKATPELAQVPHPSPSCILLSGQVFPQLTHSAPLDAAQGVTVQRSQRAESLRASVPLRNLAIQYEEKVLPKSSNSHALSKPSPDSL